MVWLGFLDLFLVFLDLMEEIWLLDLDLGFARDWFMNTKNIFSSYEKIIESKKKKKKKNLSF